MCWITEQTHDKVVQVIPVDDLWFHDEDVDWESMPFDDAPVSRCTCGTRREVNEKGMWVIVHASFDGREALEWAQDILNK